MGVIVSIWLDGGVFSQAVLLFFREPLDPVKAVAYFLKLILKMNAF